MEIAGVFLRNFAHFDFIIFVLAGWNVWNYLATRRDAAGLFRHFNRTDHLGRLDDGTRMAIRQVTRQEDRPFTGEELLETYIRANKRYARYVSVTSLFPLLGMLGTVISLISMVSGIGLESTGAFFSALTSTFWGLVAAIAFKGLDATLSYMNDVNEKYMEHLFDLKKREREALTVGGADETQRTDA